MSTVIAAPRRRGLPGFWTVIFGIIFALFLYVTFVRF